MIEDDVIFGDTFRPLPSRKVPLGCTIKENKLFYTQEVDGILGLGPGDSKFI